MLLVTIFLLSPAGSGYTKFLQRFKNTIRLNRDMDCKTDNYDGDDGTDNLQSQINDIQQSINSLKKDMSTVLRRQDDLGSLLSETNVLLRRNLGLFTTTSSHHRFPLKTEEDLAMIEDELSGQKRPEIITILKEILSGSLSNIERALGKEIIMKYNYDGQKGKKPLRKYELLIAAFNESTAKEGRSYEDFLFILRSTLKRLKNRYNKEIARTRVSKINSKH